MQLRLRNSRAPWLSLSYWILCAAAIAVALGGLQLRGQILYGSLLGNVTDASGSAVPGAAVRITQTETGEARESRTNDTGVYSFPAIPAGTYSVEIRKDGFQTATRQSVAVINNSAVRVDV